MNSQDDMSEMFDSVPGLTTLQRETVKARYRFLLAEYRHRTRIYVFLFYTLRITMTVGSLTVPALLSLKVDSPVGETALYWTTWAISLAVTTSNGIMTLFKLDKRFFMLHGVAERLRTETWQYLTLAGRYSGYYNSEETPTHANQYVHYCTNIEKIRMRHMDDEYISVGEGGDGNKTKVNPGAVALAAAQAAAAQAAAAQAAIQAAATAATTGIQGSQPPSVSQAAAPSVAAVPTLPPAGTMLPTFMSPTRGGDVPTPPMPMSRRASHARISLFPQPTVGTQQQDAASTPPSNQEEPRSAMSVSDRSGGTV